MKNITGRLACFSSVGVQMFRNRQSSEINFGTDTGTGMKFRLAKFCGHTAPVTAINTNNVLHVNSVYRCHCLCVSFGNSTYRRNACLYTRVR